MAKKKPHSATPALKILEDAGISHEVHTFSAGSDHFGDHAVAELGTDPERVFKTLVVDLSAGKGSHPLGKSINCLRLLTSQHSCGTLFLSLGAVVGWTLKSHRKT